ncbi:hypothetical protein THRCLA_10602 [Thraustotheca clavata]|uniref:Ion transport domain-containing protein n=1 Tax=Thraustotheca clavata TaxID=74557 RepID=A0A1V9YJT7_9STRA|nr:hypothetical protein THRCLA_10602 [Thraustotheca clavata]
MSEVLKLSAQVHWSIVLPDSFIRWIWNLLNMLSLVYVCLYSPYLVCFRANPLEGFISFYNIVNTTEEITWITRSDQIVELFYAIDIMLNFRFAFVDNLTGTSSTQIRKHYLEGWFLFDLFLIMPWDLIANTSQGNSAPYLALFQSLSIARLSKLLRVLKVG